ncbi:MAG TPA: hypothetical protein VGG39_21660 [Polyangiaceae bacterium]|jgi:hypothetical protein
MNALYRSWADDTSEETVPGDVLSASGELRWLGDDVFPIELFLDDGWDGPSLAMRFFVAGGAPAVLRRQVGRQHVTEARGVVKRIEEDRLILGTPGSTSREVSLGYRLPASIDLRPLVGRKVRATLEQESTRAGCSQTLVIRTADEREWLVARCGVATESLYTLGGAVVGVNLGSGTSSPLVLLAPSSRHVVPPGGEARLRVGASRYVAELVSRDDTRAAYTIVDDRLWH